MRLCCENALLTSSKTSDETLLRVCKYCNENNIYSLLLISSNSLYTLASSGGNGGRSGILLSLSICVASCPNNQSHLSRQPQNIGLLASLCLIISSLLSRAEPS